VDIIAITTVIIAIDMTRIHPTRYSRVQPLSNRWGTHGGRGSATDLELEETAVRAEGRGLTHFRAEDTSDTPITEEYLQLWPFISYKY